MFHSVYPSEYRFLNLCIIYDNRKFYNKNLKFIKYFNRSFTLCRPQFSFSVLWRKKTHPDGWAFLRLNLLLETVGGGGQVVLIAFTDVGAGANNVSHSQQELGLGSYVHGYFLLSMCFYCKRSHRSSTLMLHVGFSNRQQT